MMQQQNLHYVVDIDINGFFDNVNHNKLLRQIWQFGIRDRKLLKIIKIILKSPIKMPDGTIIKSDRGTPQGGILSPLLSNIVLNELDWWISSQWESFPIKNNYSCGINNKGVLIKSNQYRALRRSNLKEMYIVRYADDFKIFCKNYSEAKRIFIATKLWLKDRLKLDVSLEKSKHTKDEYKYVNLYNSTVWGIHNYYQYATDINEDCNNISYQINNILKIRLGIEIWKN